MAESEFDHLRRKVVDYLKQRRAAGARFVKSRHIAADLDASVKRIGVAMGEIEQDQARDVDIQRWGGQSDGLTWVIN